MDILLVFIGIVGGFVVSYLIFNLKNKAEHVSKEVYESLHSRFNETHTQWKIAEDRLSSQQEESAKQNRQLESLASEKALLQSSLSSLETRLSGSEQKINELSDSLTEKTKQNDLLQAEIHSLKQALTEKTVKNEALVEKLETQKEEILTIQKTAQLQFEKIASQILEEKSGKFTETNKNNMEAILKPLGEHLETFKKKVEETYDKESKQRFSLEEKVKELIEQTNKVSAEANNLASALKGQAKTQGNWGEMILESILQHSGLVKDREYFLQETIRNEEGKNLRPDVLVKLPDKRIIIIDSKVSLVDYERFSSAETVDEQAIHLNNHLRSIRAHIDELSFKQYDNLGGSLDFTMMFVPIEPAYLLAIQSDPNLWSYAYSKRILLISPTNLIACLKLMADLWKREMQSKNAQEIVNRGELLYEKCVSFLETFKEIGKFIDRTQQTYTSAYNLLSNGRGNLIGQAVKLKELGLKSSKAIPEDMIPSETENELKEES